MTFVFANEMRCLSNAVLQACLREHLQASLSIPSLVRRIVTDNKIAVGKVAIVTIHQCPQDDHVEYNLHVCVVGGQCANVDFHGASCEAAHETYVLYDRRRDGECQHLHLVH
jgi:hypothetical protein